MRKDNEIDKITSNVFTDFLSIHLANALNHNYQIMFVIGSNDLNNGESVLTLYNEVIGLPKSMLYGVDVAIQFYADLDYPIALLRAGIELNLLDDIHYIIIT